MEHKKFIGLNDDIIKIRTSVFVDKQGFKDEFDETDKTCTHIVCMTMKSGLPLADILKREKIIT